MSFIKYLREYAPINAGSATYIPFDKSDDQMTNGRWLPSSCQGGVDVPCDDDKETTVAIDDKEQQLNDIFSRLRELILNKQTHEDEEFEDDFQEDTGESQSDDFDEEEPQQPVKRFVKNAHLVYKRQMPDGLFEELWIYNIGKNSKNDEFKIRRDILGNTDIQPHETVSKDGSQSYSTWTAGNAQLLHITGLPN